MTDLHERKKSFESLFAHDAELRFKVHARCSRVLGKWAAEKMHLSDTEREAYVGACVEVGVKPDGMHKLAIKIHDDMKTKEATLATLRDIKTRIERSLVDAKNMAMKGEALE